MKQNNCVRRSISIIIIGSLFLSSVSFSNVSVLASESRNGDSAIGNIPEEINREENAEDELLRGIPDKLSDKLTKNRMTAYDDSIETPDAEPGESLIQNIDAEIEENDAKAAPVEDEHGVSMPIARSTGKIKIYEIDTLDIDESINSNLDENDSKFVIDNSAIDDEDMEQAILVENERILSQSSDDIEVLSDTDFNLEKTTNESVDGYVSGEESTEIAGSFDGGNLIQTDEIMDGVEDSESGIENGIIDDGGVEPEIFIEEILNTNGEMVLAEEGTESVTLVEESTEIAGSFDGGNLIQSDEMVDDVEDSESGTENEIIDDRGVESEILIEETLNMDDEVVLAEEETGSVTLAVEGTCGQGVIWRLYEDTGILVIEGTGTMDDYTNSSAVPWKDYSDSIVKVVVKDGVANIGMNAFADCFLLVQAELSDEITSIGFRAFYNCKKLRDVNIPLHWSDCPTSKAGTLSIDYCGHVFEGCESLTKLIVPEGMTEIPSFGFCYSDYLTEVELPSTLTSIKNHTFSMCDKLVDINVPIGVKTIGKSAFYYDSMLENVVMPEGIIELGSFLFYECTSLQKIVLPDSIEKIGYMAFANCKNLQEVNIPLQWNECPTSSTSGTVSAEYCGHIFEECELLTIATVPEGMTTLPAYAFTKCNYLKQVNLPSTLMDITHHAFYECTSLETINIPEGVTYIGKSAFYFCSSLRSVEMSDKITELALYAFYNCTKLEQVSLPDGIEKIGYQAFANCSNLSSVNIPQNWNDCPSASTSGSLNANSCGHIFEGCIMLKHVVVPEGMTEIPGFGFNSCDYIESIELPSTLTIINNQNFYCCIRLKTITIPEGVTNIGKSGFYGCSVLETIEIPDTVTNLGSFSFEECSKLKNVLLPDGIEKIGYRAFANCSALEGINIPLSWIECFSSQSGSEGTEYQGSIFVNCIELVQLEVPEGVTKLPDYAFCNCNYLREVYLPNSLTAIGEYSFYGCSSLTSTNLSSGVSIIPDSAFANCTALLSINIPETVSTVESRAFNNCSSLINVNYSASESSWNNISISSTGNGALNSIVINYNFSVQYTEQDFLGVWEGEYDGNSGTIVVRRHFVVKIDTCTVNRNTGTLSGTVTFSPSDKADAQYAANGSYQFSGTVNMLTGVFFYQGHTWIEYPKEYDNFEFVTFDGLFEAGKTSITGINDKTPSRTFDANRLGASKVTNTEVILSRDGQQYDLLKEVQYVDQNSDEYMTVMVLPDWDGAEEGIVRLFQSNVAIESATGAFIDIQPGKVFSPSEKIFVALVDAFGQVVETKKTKLVIEVDGQNRLSKPTKNTSLTIYQNKNKSNVEQDEYELCEGATITNGGNTYTSDKNGKVSIPTLSDGSILVEKSGHVSRTLTADQLKESSVIRLQKENEKYPVISAVWVNDESDVLNDTYALNMVSKENVTLKAEIEWGSSTYESIKLVQDAKTISFSGDSLSTVISDNFDTSQTIYIVATNNDGKVSKKALQFENGTTSKVVKSLEGAKFDFSSSISVTLPDSVPEFFQNTKISAGVSSIVPVTISADNGKVYVAIGADLVSYGYSEKSAKSTSSGNVAHVLKRETKTFIEKFKDTGVLDGSSASKSLQKLKNFQQTYKTAIKYPQGSFGVDADITLLGFAEGCFDNSGNITWLDGGIILNPSVSIKRDCPFSLPVGPIVLPMYFETAFTANVLGQLNVRFNETAKNFIPNGEIKGDISLSGGVGVGIKKVIYFGGGLTGKLSPDWKIIVDADDYFKLTASVNAYAKAGIACFEASKDFDPVYNAVWIEVPESTNQDQMEILSDDEFDIYNTSDYEMKDLTYLDEESVFIANNESIEEGINLLGEDTGEQMDENVTVSGFKTNVYRESTPQIVSWKDGRQLAVWIDGTSDNANELVLYYSYYDGSAWTTPEIVYNDGTMDYSPTLVMLGDNAYLTWQNATKPFDFTASSTLDDIAGDFDISVAEFEVGTGFATTTIQQDNLDMMPYLCSNGDDAYVVWCNNTQNDWLGNNSNNSICACKISGTSHGNVVVEYDGLNAIDSLCADYDTELHIAYSMDGDGDITSADDLRVFEDGSRVSASEYAESSPAYMDHQLYWYSNNNIINQKGSITGGVIPTDRYEIIEVDGRKAVIYTVADGLNSSLKISYLNEETNTWGDPMSISDGTDYIGSYSVTVGTDNSLVILVSSTEVLESYGAEDPYGSSSLKMISPNPQCDIALSDVVYDEDTFCSGSPMDFHFKITNNGTIPVETTVAKIWDAENNLLSSLDIVSLILPGETIDASTYFTVPEDCVEEDITLTIVPKDLVDDTDSDNLKKIHLIYEDLAIEDIIYGQNSDGKCVISADVVNRGYSERKQIKVTLLKDSLTGEVIDYKVIDTISSMDVYSEYFEVNAEDGDIYYVLLEQADDQIESNNSDFVKISIQDGPEYVEEMILGLPPVDGLIIDDKDTVEVIREKYDALSEEEKEKIPQATKDILVAAEERISVLEQGEAEKEHKWDAGVITIAPTCTTTGVEIFTCTICEEINKETIAALGHDLVHYTATVSNIEYWHCSRCGKNFSDSTGAQEINSITPVVSIEPEESSTPETPGTPEKHTHSWGAWSVTVTATVFATEQQTRVCSTCKQTENRSYGSKLTPTISLNASSLKLKKGQSTTAFKVSGMANGDSVKSVTSNKTKILKVSSYSADGKIKLKAQNKTGTAKLTIMLASGLKKAVTVKVQSGRVETTKISGLVKKMTLEKGKKATLSPVITPITSLQKISYKTSNKKVATVSGKGVITAKGAGTAKITVQSGKKKATVTVTVPKVKTAAIKNVPAKKTLKAGKSYTLKAKLVPAGSGDKITYTSSNKKIVTVNSKGKITGKKKGTAVITVKAGKTTVKCTVTVK